MNDGKVCVYIPVEEYRELVRAQRDAEHLKNLLCNGPLTYVQTDMLCQMFGVKKETKEEE